MKILVLLLSMFTPMLFAMAAKSQSACAARLRRVAVDYYDGRNRNYPVASSDAGLHMWDNKLTDYSPTAIEARRQHVRSLLAQVNAMRTENWKKDDRIDWLLFRSQLEGIAFFDRAMDFEHADPQTYVKECSNSIFSLLKKDSDTPRNRAL